MKGNVLIVDDDLGCGRLLALLIRHLGHQARHVPNGYKAMEAMSADRPDLVILDVMMPGIDGLEVLRRIREDPSTANVPVIMFSALADPVFSQSVREKGANDYWVKASLDFSALRERIGPYLPPTEIH